MKTAFWHDRWKKDQIGFHNEEVNERLTRHWPTLAIEEGATVFAPLCGKSLDMHLLHEQGHPVVGVDLSPIAIRAFFSEAGVTPREDSSGSFTRSRAEGFDLYCGDLLDLTNILPERVTILLITLEYDQSKMSGPPHSVPPSEVEDLFGSSFDVEALWSSGWIDAPPRFRARGLETRNDTVMRLDRLRPA